MRWTLFRFVSRFKGAQDRAALNETFATAFAASLAVAALLSVVAVIMAGVLPDAFHLAGQDRGTFRRVVMLLGTGAAFTVPFQFLGAYLRGLQRFDLDSLGQGVSSVVRMLVLIATLRAGYGVLGVAWASLGVTILTFFLYWRLVRRADPELPVARLRPSWRRARELVGYSAYVLMNTGGQSLRVSSDSIMVGQIFGLGMVTPYNVASRLLSYVRMIAQSANGPVMSQMSEFDGARRQDEVRQVLLRSTRGMTLLSLFLSLVLILDGRLLIRCWVGNAFLASYPILVILTLGSLVVCSMEPCRLVVFAQARYHRALGWWSLAEGAASVAMAVLLAGPMGLAGVALGLSIPAVLVRALVQPRYALRSCALSAVTFLGRGLLGPVAAATAFTGVCLLVGQPGTASLTVLAATFAWQGALFAVFAYVLMRNPLKVRPGRPETRTVPPRAGLEVAGAMRKE
jgi:O-antigen/teichoic acid export membrane protein